MWQRVSSIGCSCNANPRACDELTAAVGGHDTHMFALSPRRSAVYVPPETSLAFLSTFRAANMTRIPISWEHIINSGRRRAALPSPVEPACVPVRAPPIKSKSEKKAKRVSRLSVRRRPRSLSTYTYIRSAVSSVVTAVSLSLGQMTLALAPVAAIDPTFLLQPVTLRLTDTHPVRLYGARAAPVAEVAAHLRVPLVPPASAGAGSRAPLLCLLPRDRRAAHGDVHRVHAHVAGRRLRRRREPPVQDDSGDARDERVGGDPEGARAESG